MKHLGDITKIDGRTVPKVCVVIGGSPCQDLSVAGKRSGLSGERSGLFMEMIRIIKEMREDDKRNGRTGSDVRPRFMVWENVPGAFSSNKGEDFRIVLEEIVKVVSDCTVIPRPPKNKWRNTGVIMGDGFSVAWRVLDAQFWGVPQRRRRIALVADFGGCTAPEILFERESLSGYSAEGFRAWQRTAGSAADCAHATGVDRYNGQLTGDVSATLGVNCGMSTGRNGIVLNDQGDSRMDVTDEVTCTLRAESHHPPCVMDTPAVIPLEHHPIDSRIKIEESNAIQTLTSRMGTGGNNVPLVMSDECAPVTLKIRSGCEGGGKGVLLQENKSSTLSCNNDQTLFQPKAYGISSKDSNGMKSTNPHVGFYEAVTARTLDANGGNPACNQGGIAVVAFAQNQRNEVRDLGEKSAVVCANAGTKQQTFVLQDHAAEHDAIYAMTTGRDTFNQGRNAAFSPTFDEELQPTLVAKGPGAVQSGYTVRRLTPLECERLQGFPDGWTDIGEWTDSKGKAHKTSDSARYKALGNSIALPPWRYVLSGVIDYCSEKTMASLFDGIGGFPLIWREIGGNTVWASEIEEFPIAVTKKHFN